MVPDYTLVDKIFYFCLKFALFLAFIYFIYCLVLQLQLSKKKKKKKRKRVALAFHWKNFKFYCILIQ